VPDNIRRKSQPSKNKGQNVLVGSASQKSVETKIHSNVAIDFEPFKKLGTNNGQVAQLLQTCHWPFRLSHFFFLVQAALEFVQGNTK